LKIFLRVVVEGAIARLELTPDLPESSRIFPTQERFQ